MDWDEVQVFLAVARAGRLATAGKALGVDRTTAGRRLAALEARLGVPLFARTREGLVPTPAGERARAHAERMEEAARALAADVAPADEATGVVRLAVTEAFAPFLVESGLLSVSADHPGLRLVVLGGNRRLDLTAGEADLALRVDPIRGASLRARRVNSSPVSLFASKGYLDRAGTPREQRQLAGHDVLLPGGGLEGLPEARWLAACADVRVRFESDSLPALVEAARAGEGIVPLVAMWGDRDPELVRLFDVPGLPPRAIWLVSTAESAKRPAVRAVAERLIEILGPG